MKNINILYKGRYLKSANSESSLFLQIDNSLALIHFVEHQNGAFKRRLEFKKYYSESNTKNVFFSIYITPTLVFSGNIILTNDSKLISGGISYHFLYNNSTRIEETYHITLNERYYFLEYQKPCHSKSELLISQNVPQEIDLYIILYNILIYINNERTLQNKDLIPPGFNIFHILANEQKLLAHLEELVPEYPEIREFFKAYQSTSASRKRNKKNNISPVAVS